MPNSAGAGPARRLAIEAAVSLWPLWQVLLPCPRRNGTSRIVCRYLVVNKVMTHDNETPAGRRRIT
jgi:hypothetical protein